MASMPDGENKLVLQCISLQKRRAWVIGPAIFGFALLAWLTTWAWQVGLIALALLSSNVAFAGALRLARRQQLNESLWLSFVPIFLVGLLVILLFDGLGMAMILMVLSLVVQSAILSKKMVVLGGISTVALLTVEQLLHNFELYQRFPVSPMMSFWITTVVSGAMIFLFLMYLSRHFERSQAASIHFSELSEKQARIIEAIGETMPSLEDSVEKITGVSTEVASRATAQAEAMDAMVADVKTMIESAAGTSVSAEESNRISSSMQREINENSTRLQKVSEIFETALKNIQDARQIMGNLVSNTENIESILSYNRDIGEHIKVLSVNASIEAASAGEFGAGFAVVARELREMITNSEFNLARTRNLLDQIRGQSESGMRAIDATWSVFEKVFSELAHTRDLLVNSAGSANAASRQLKQISAAAEVQQTDLLNVSSKVSMLLNSAFELAISSANLTDIVARLDELKKTLSRSV